MRAKEFISKEIFEEIYDVGFEPNFIKGTYTEIKGILYDLHIPTYSEVFAWFRNRHNIYACVKDEAVNNVIYFQYHFRYFQQKFMSSAFNSHDEAEIAALEYVMVHFRKMIQARKKEIEENKELIEF